MKNNLPNMWIYRVITALGVSEFSVDSDVGLTSSWIKFDSYPSHFSQEILGLH